MNPFAKSNLSYSLRGKKVLLGITGSIAAFKACDIIRHLRDCGAMTRVILTEGAENFVTRTTLETLSGMPVLTRFWEEAESKQNYGTHHIDTARWADLILVAPATAHFIGKMANGLGDDLLSTELLAFQGPVLVTPAMNPAMFSHPAVQENINRLASRKVQILGPTRGVTSCGEEGLGRMIEPEQIVEEVASAFYRPLTGKKMVITLGPTRSAVDPVRYFTNRSSGRMGAALCWAAVGKGYRVTAICGPVDVQLPTQAEIIRVQTAQEMADASLRLSDSADVFIASAAVLDWNIKNYSTEKLKKESGPLQMEFEKTPDILSLVSEKKRANQFILGFAAETSDPVAHAIQKRRTKGCNAIFVNDVSLPSQGFESDMNGGWWIPASEQIIQVDVCPKAELARTLLSFFTEEDQG